MSWLHVGRFCSPLFWAGLTALCAGCGDDAGGGDSSGGSTTSAPGSTSAATSDGPSTDGPASDGPSDSGATGTTASDTTGTATAVDSSSGGSDGTTGAAVDCWPVIKEVVYDVTGPSDDQLQWVQLYNPCDRVIDVSTYTIAYAGEDWATWFKPLLGSVAPGMCYVVGGPEASPVNGDPDIDFADDFSPGLFRDDLLGGGVALFELPPEQITIRTVPLDAVIYGPNNDSGLMDASGAVPGDAHVPHPVEGGSIQRTSLADTWEVAATPGPDACPGF
jgi:hypothetical protein